MKAPRNLSALLAPRYAGEEVRITSPLGVEFVYWFGLYGSGSGRVYVCYKVVAHHVMELVLTTNNFATVKSFVRSS